MRQRSSRRSPIAGPATGCGYADLRSVGTAAWQRDFVLNYEASLIPSVRSQLTPAKRASIVARTSSTLVSRGQRQLPGSGMEILFHEFAAEPRLPE